MTFWLFVLLMSTPSLIERASDPMAGWLPSELSLRDLDCTPLSVERAREVAPGEVTEPSARGDFFERRAVVCRERLMPHGARRPQDDAILSGLRASSDQMAGTVAGLQQPQRTRTWLVETFYPDSAVAAKISFALKGSLLDRGLRVSDRVPTLAAGDIEVLGQLEPSAAYPLACARFSAAGSLRPDDALLAVVLRDPRETILHAGVCADGSWRWLQ